MSIRRKLLILLLSVALIPLLVIVVMYQISINYVSNMVSKDIFEALDESARFNMKRMLAEYGSVIVKFFFHISKKEQKRRFKTQAGGASRSLRRQPPDWEHFRRYDDYLLAVEEMLERTDTEWGPWTIVEATSSRYAHFKVLDRLIARLDHALEEVAPLAPAVSADGQLLPDDAASGDHVAGEEV